MLDQWSFLSELFTSLLLPKIIAILKNYFEDSSQRRKIEKNLKERFSKFQEFLKNEKITKEQANILFEEIGNDLVEYQRKPQEILQGSYDENKIYNIHFQSRKIPQRIKDEGIEHLHAAIFKMILREIFFSKQMITSQKTDIDKYSVIMLNKIDESVQELKKISLIPEVSANNPSMNVLSKVIKNILQSIIFKIDLSGLFYSAQYPLYTKDNGFIIPMLATQKKDVRTNEEKEIIIETEDDIIKNLSNISGKTILEGSPGSGKSTFCLWLQKELLMKNDFHLPILIKLRDLINEDNLPSYSKLIIQNAGPNLADQITDEMINEWCTQGYVSFIFDGFDEIAVQKREKFIQWIKSFNAATDKSNLILASRPLSSSQLDDLDNTWIKWEIRSFDEKRIIKYIKNWYLFSPIVKNNKHAIDASFLAKSWLSDNALKPLVSNPLLLATILMVHHIDNKLPNGRAKLYSRYIDGMLDLWDNNKKKLSTINISNELKRKILLEIAIHLHNNELIQMDNDEIRIFLDKLLSELNCTFTTEEILSYLVERTGLIVGPGAWSFVHKTLSEYFVATEICKGNRITPYGERLDRMRLYMERHNDRWTSILFFWAALTNPIDLEEFLDELLYNDNDNDFLLAISIFYDNIHTNQLSTEWRDTFF